VLAQIITPADNIVPVGAVVAKIKSLEE
jgi:hypothetical protein